MTSKFKKIVGYTAMFALVGTFGAQAASISNADADAQTLVVTEDGIRNEVVIEAGETINICASGCFVTLPNGDRAALSGGESVRIVDGAAIIE